MSAAALCAAAMIVGGCTSSGATPSASPTPTPTPTATPTASPTSVASGLYLRYWMVAPLGPQWRFASVPIVISDGKLLTVEPVVVVNNKAPMYQQPVSRTITEAGLARILAEAQNDGLLGSKTVFECPPDPEGGIIAGTPWYYMQVIVGGVNHEFNGGCRTVTPSAPPGTPAPGTWYAFEEFRSHLADPAAWLGADLGPKTEYDASSLAVLVMPFGPDSVDSPDTTSPVTWPLGPFASFGKGDTNFRCAVVTGGDAATLLPIVKTAFRDSTFIDGTGAYANLVVRVFQPGEPDICADY
jgi:hypothetical protein